MHIDCRGDDCGGLFAVVVAAFVFRMVRVLAGSRDVPIYAFTANGLIGRDRSAEVLRPAKALDSG